MAITKLRSLAVLLLILFALLISLSCANANHLICTRVVAGDTIVLSNGEKADTSPRILNLLLDHALGKPPEHIQQEQVMFILRSGEDTKAQDAEVVDGEQKSVTEVEGE